ncbi:hypothetical protein [Tepidimicrobium xylanilyticum]
MVENIRIYINEVDYTEYAIMESFRIDLRERDYGASVSFFLPHSQLSGIIPSVELKILDGEKLLFAGIVEGIQFREKTKEEILINVNCGNFNIIPTRRTISGVIDPEDYAGDLVRRYIENYLFEEGVTEGIIEQGIQLYETEYYDWDTLSIAEILNNLADASGFEWYIDMRKRLHFGKLNPSPTHHTSEETRLIPQNHNYRDLEVNTSLENYRNKVFVIGGEPIEEVPEENLNYDYLLKVAVQNDNEIQKMAELNNDSGVWGYVVRDPNIVTLQDATNKANSELEKYGQIPVNINVRTRIDYFSIGDTISVDLPLYGITNATFMIENIRIEFFGKDLVYNLRITNKTAQAGQKEDLYKFIEKMVKEIKRNNRTIQTIKREDDGTVRLPKQGLELWVDAQKEGTIVFGENNKIQTIKDANTGNNALLQLDPLYQPTIINSGGFNWISFNPDPYPFEKPQRGDFFNFSEEKLIGTAFVVYIDRTPTGNAYQVGYSCPIGYLVQGGPLTDRLLKNNDYNLYINGIAVDKSGQNRIRNTKMLMTIEDIDGNITENRNKLIYVGLNSSSPGDSEFNNYFVGEIAEIIVYSRVITEQERNTITNYLMKKYNIA